MSCAYTIDQWIVASVSWRHSQSQTCRQTTLVLISRNYTILGGTHKWANKWCNRLTTELPRKKHSGTPVCRICQIDQSHGSETGWLSKPYSCVFFSSSLRTCLSNSESYHYILLLEDGSIHTFDVEPVWKARPHWSGSNSDIHSFGDLLDISVSDLPNNKKQRFWTYLPCFDEDAHSRTHENHPTGVLVIIN